MSIRYWHMVGGELIIHHFPIAIRLYYREGTQEYKVVVGQQERQFEAASHNEAIKVAMKMIGEILYERLTNYGEDLFDFPTLIVD